MKVERKYTFSNMYTVTQFPSHSTSHTVHYQSFNTKTDTLYTLNITKHIANTHRHKEGGLE